MDIREHLQLHDSASKHERREDHPQPPGYSLYDPYYLNIRDTRHLQHILILTKDEVHQYASEHVGPHHSLLDLVVRARFAYPTFASIALISQGKKTCSEYVKSWPKELEMRLKNKFLAMDPEVAFALASLNRLVGVLEPKGKGDQVLIFIQLVGDMLDDLLDHGDSKKDEEVVISMNSRFLSGVQEDIADKGGVMGKLLTWYLLLRGYVSGSLLVSHP